MPAYPKPTTKKTVSAKLQSCIECRNKLPRKMFTSIRARICNNCRILRKLRQSDEMQHRQIERLKKKKQKTKGVITKANLKKKVQKVFNKWIRERDKDLPCLACGKPSDKMDASHFFAMGSNGALRYVEENVHSTCVGCNRFKHGNLLLYRIGLVMKIGINNVRWLEEHRNDIHKFTREELNLLLEKYSD